jgi:hypothetical protein
VTLEIRACTRADNDEFRYCAYLTELRGVREVPTSQAVSLRSLVLSFLPTSLVQPPLLSIFDYEHSVTKKLVTASRQFSCTYVTNAKPTQISEST